MDSCQCHKHVTDEQVCHYDTELHAANQVKISIDLVACAKRYLNFLRVISGLPNLHGGALVSQAIKRYQNCWMPLAAKHEGITEKILPPLDVEWVWLCHCLNAKHYQEFCKLHYLKIIDVPLLSDPSMEVRARERCKSIWSETYPNEPFEIDILKKVHTAQSPKAHQQSQLEENISVEAVVRQSHFYNQAYMCDEKFLEMCKARYKCFLYMLHKSKGKLRFLPTSDIQLMCQSHKVSPMAYALDTDNFLSQYNHLLSQGQLDNSVLHTFKNTAREWESIFGHPYERAGASCQILNTIGTISPLETNDIIPVTINWPHQVFDTNSKYEALHPRYVHEVCLHIKNSEKCETCPEEDSLFIYARPMKACTTLKLRLPLQNYKQDSAWHKLLLLQSEISVEGLILELRSCSRKCLGAPCFSKLLGETTFTWKEIESESLLAIDKSFVLKKKGSISSGWIIAASITPPVLAQYLLQSFPDCVTDDSGAMISKRVLRSNKHKPQEGRWMSRTVLNHEGKECFIIRIRIATGIWKSKNQRPVGVDWNERMIHIHGGGWNYIKGSVGIAPDRIIATATPLADELEQYKMKWSFSTGEMLTIQMPIENLEWEKELRLSLKGNNRGMVRLLNGRQLQYQVPSSVPDEEEGFVTVIRYTAEFQQGRATALFNWKLSAMEVLPEEDAVLVLLICTAIQLTVADLGGKILTNNFYNRKKRRKDMGKRDWGSLVMGGGEDVPSELMQWYLNPEEVLKVSISEEEDEGVLPKGASDHMYRGTSWLYSGSTKGLYKMSSKGSWESFGRDGFEHLFRFGSLTRFGSQTKIPAMPH